MKKLILLILLFILPFSAFAIITTSYEGEQKIYGFVDTTNFLDINLDIVMPFNLLDPQIQNQNISPTDSLISGLRIGTWTMLSNTPNFHITISHTPLTNAKGQKVDYALHFFIDQNTKAISTQSGKTTTLTSRDITPSVKPGGQTYEIIAHSLYLSLLTPEAQLQNDSLYAAGDYNSTLTIEMVTE